MLLADKKWVLNLAMVLLWVAACHAEPAPKQYDKAGLAFSYPSQWQLKEDREAALGGPRYIGIDIQKSSSLTVEVFDRARLQHKPGEDSSLMGLLKRYAEYFKKRDGFSKLATITPVEQAAVQRGGLNGLIEKREMTFMNKKTGLVREFYRVEAGDHVAFIVLDTDGSEYKSNLSGMEMVLKSFKLQQ